MALPTSTRSGIYEIRNTINGHRYIGSAVDFKSRWGRHRRDLGKQSHHSEHLQRAWNKYGEEAFEFNIIVKLPIMQLIRVEDIFIYEEHPEYNVSKSSYSPMRGRKMSDETKRKIGDALRVRVIKDSTREKLRIINTGRKLSEETKLKISLSKTGNSPAPNKGIPCRESTKLKISEAKRGKSNHWTGRHHTEESKARMRIAQQNKPPVSEETRAKLSIATSNYWKRRKEEEAYVITS